MGLIDTFSKEALEEIIKNSNSYAEVVNKIGYTSGTGDIYTLIKNKIIEYGISISHFKQVNKMKRNPENVFIENSTANQSTLRKWYIKGKYSEYKCAICGQEPFWNNKELSLTLDHINGKNHDDRLENLRWICPNCDRQLDTFGGRNKPAHQKKKKYCTNCGKEISKDAILCRYCYSKIPQPTRCPNKEELLKCIVENKGNFCAIGRQYEVSDNTIRRWCKKYNISYHSADYKNSSEI